MKGRQVRTTNGDVGNRLVGEEVKGKAAVTMQLSHIWAGAALYA